METSACPQDITQCSSAAHPFAFAWAWLVDLFLLVHTQLTGTHIDQQKETTHDGQNLEEVVLCKVLVRVVLVKL